MHRGAWIPTPPRAGPVGAGDMTADRPAEATQGHGPLVEGLGIADGAGYRNVVAPALGAITELLTVGLGIADGAGYRNVVGPEEGAPGDAADPLGVPAGLVADADGIEGATGVPEGVGDAVTLEAAEVPGALGAATTGEELGVTDSSSGSAPSRPASAGATGPVVASTRDTPDPAAVAARTVVARGPDAVAAPPPRTGLEDGVGGARETPVGADVAGSGSAGTPGPPATGPPQACRLKNAAAQPTTATTPLGRNRMFRAAPTTVEGPGPATSPKT